MPVQYSDRMSDADALLWNNELDPMLRSTILSVMILDGAPDEARFAQAVERSLARIPRLRQHVVLDPIRAAPPRWENDPRFDLEYHLRRVALPGRGHLRDLLDFAAPVAMQAFDKDRPLWEIYRVEGLEGGREAVVIKLHHAISDGVGLVRMTSSLVERTREPDPRRENARPVSVLDAPPGDERSPFEETLDAIRYRAEQNLSRTSRLAASLARGAGRLARDPAGALRSLSQLAGSIGRQLRPVTEPMSPVMVARSLAVHFEVVELGLEDLRRAARAVGGTVNDAFVASVCGGLRLFHEHYGAPVAQLRMTMPVNLRSGSHGDTAGNQFAPARFAVPIAISDPAERMRAIGAAVRAERNEPALPLTEEIAGVLSRMPAALSVRLFGSMLKAIDFVTSNVPGPPYPVYASGARVERMFGFGPLSGAAVNVTLFSYDGNANLAINCDPAAVPDGAFLAECIAKGAEEVLSVS